MERRVVLVGIAGGSCSGKTTLAERVRTRLGATPAAILPVDAYYRDLSHLPAEARAARNFDEPAAVDHALLAAHVRELAHGAVVQRPVYDFATHCRSARVERVDPGGVVIVEGLFALAWAEVREHLSLGVFVEAGHEVCLARRTARDVRERGRTPESVEEQYAATVRPMYDLHVLPTRAHADLVVDGAAPPDVAEAALLARLAALRGAP